MAINLIIIAQNEPYACTYRYVVLALFNYMPNYTSLQLII